MLLGPIVDEGGVDLEVDGEADDRDAESVPLGEHPEAFEPVPDHRLRARFPG
jgi:hypothetical protein